MFRNQETGQPDGSEFKAPSTIDAERAADPDLSHYDKMMDDADQDAAMDAERQQQASAEIDTQLDSLWDEPQVAAQKTAESDYQRADRVAQEEIANAGTVAAFRKRQGEEGADAATLAEIDRAVDRYSQQAADAWGEAQKLDPVLGEYHQAMDQMEQTQQQPLPTESAKTRAEQIPDF